LECLTKAPTYSKGGKGRPDPTKREKAGKTITMNGQREK